MNCGMECIKYILFIFNFFFAVSFPSEIIIKYRVCLRFFTANAKHHKNDIRKIARILTKMSRVQIPASLPWGKTYKGYNRAYNKSRCCCFCAIAIACLSYVMWESLFPRNFINAYKKENLYSMRNINKRLKERWTK